MTSNKLRLPRLLLLLAVLALGVVGCKQGVGEVCQIDDDCSSGSCNAATGKCQEPGAGGGQDAAPVVDASTVDAPPVDAAVDASTVDAAVDAAVN